MVNQQQETQRSFEVMMELQINNSLILISWNMILCTLRYMCVNIDILCPSKLQHYIIAWPYKLPDRVLRAVSIAEGLPCPTDVT